MRSKLVPLFAILAIGLSVVACSPTSKQVSVEISCDDFANLKHISKQAEVAAGGSLTVTLCSNRTTGFQWSESAQISDQAVLQQTSHEFLAPETKGLVGSPGKEVWTFKTNKKGTSTVSVDYSRPWAGGEKGEWTFALNVTVK